jgi:hypothetical protein
MNREDLATRASPGTVLPYHAAYNRPTQQRLVSEEGAFLCAPMT